MQDFFKPGDLIHYKNLVGVVYYAIVLECSYKLFLVYSIHRNRVYNFLEYVENVFSIFENV